MLEQGEGRLYGDNESGKDACVWRRRRFAIRGGRAAFSAVRELGADVVIDYTQQAIEEVVDVIQEKTIYQCADRVAGLTYQSKAC